MKYELKCHVHKFICKPFYEFVTSINSCFWIHVWIVTFFQGVDSSDTQLCMTLDGEEIYYADFKKGDLVWNGRLPTSLHVSWAYKYAVHNRIQCKGNLQTWKTDKSATTKTKVKLYSPHWFFIYCLFTFDKDTVSIKNIEH